MLFIFFVFVCIFSQSLSQTHQPALVNKSLITAPINSTANLLCETNKIPLTLCLWEKTSKNIGGDILISFNQKNIRALPLPGYSYYSLYSNNEGLQNGQCGLKIEKVTSADYDKWQCTLFDENGGLYRGIVDLRHPPQNKVGPSNDEVIVNHQHREAKELTPIYPSNSVPTRTNTNSVPIITALPGSTRAETLAIPSSVSPTSGSSVSGAFSEVKVESAHLEIRRRKLQTF